MDRKPFQILMIAFSVLLSLTSPQVGQANNEVYKLSDETAQFFRDMEYVIVDVRIKRNRDASYQYSTYPYIQRRLDDYVYRVEHKSFKKLLYPNGFNAEGSVDKVIKSTLENRIAETKLRDLKVIAKNSEAYKSLSPEQLAEKSVQLTFKIGQQRLPTEDDRGILIGAISVGFEKPDLLWGGMHIGVNIAPEPFIYSQRLNNRTSLDRSIDFLSLQLAEYLYFLQYIAR